MALFRGRDWKLADFLPFKYVGNWDSFWTDVLGEFDDRRDAVAGMQADVTTKAGQVASHAAAVAGHTSAVASARAAADAAAARAEAAAVTAEAAARPMTPAQIAGLTPLLDLVLTDPEGLPDGMFSRLGTATYWDATGVLRTAAAGVPRIDHDPATGRLRGLLLESAATNLVTNSEDLSVWADTLANTTVTANSAVAPDGTTTMDTLVSAATSGDRLRRKTLSVPNDSVQRVFSLHAKAGTGTAINLSMLYSGGATQKATLVTFDLASGTGSLSGGVTDGFAAQPLPGGVWRLWVTLANNGTGNTSLSLDLRPYPHPAQAAAGSVYVWGAQLESGNVPSSYIPTAGSTVTRAADVCSLTTSPWLNPAEGSLLVEAEIANATIYMPILQLDDGALNNRIYFDSGSGLARLVAYTSGALQVVADLGSLTVGAPFKIAARYKHNDYAGCFSGGNVVSDTSASVPPVTTLRLGGNGVQTLHGWLRRVTIFARQRSNSTLQLLTSG